MDPIAEAVLAAEKPKDAYEVACAFSDDLTPHLNALPQSGAIYVAWASATDIFELNGATPEAGHDVLRRMAAGWLARPAEPDEDFLRRWVADAQSAIAVATDW
jgi:hypothetical protein